MEPRRNVAAGGSAERHVQLRVAVGRPVAPQVVGQAARSRRHAHGAQASSVRGVQDAGAVQAGHEAVGPDESPDDRAHLVIQILDRGVQIGEPALVELEPQPTRGHHAGEVAMAREGFVDAQRLFLVPAESRRSVVETHASADVAQIADMVVEPLEFGQKNARHPRAGRDNRPGQALDGAAEGHGVGDGADATGVLHDGQGGIEGRALDQPLEAAMGVEEARVEMQDGLAHGRKAEVTRLDDPGVDRPDGQLIDAVAVRDEMPIGHGRGAGSPGSGTRRLVDH